MRKQFRFILAGVIMLGMLAGYSLRNLYEGRPIDRGARFAQLFQDHCVPFATMPLASQTMPKPFVPLPALGPGAWADTASGLAVVYKPGNCMVTDQLLHLSPQERQTLAAEIPKIVAAAFPQLALDPSATLGPDAVMDAWVQGALQSDERWGVLHFRFASEGEEAGTYVRLALPRSLFRPE